MIGRRGPPRAGVDYLLDVVGLKAARGSDSRSWGSAELGRARRVPDPGRTGGDNAMPDDPPARWGEFKYFRLSGLGREYGCCGDRRVRETRAILESLRRSVMSKHDTISPAEAADRLAIRELVEGYAHCADRRDAEGQKSLFTDDTHFVVYMDAKDLPKPSQELHSRARLPRSRIRRPQQVRRHDALRRTEHHPHADGGSGHGRGLHHGAPPDGRGWKAASDDRRAPLRGHLRENGRHLAVPRSASSTSVDRGARAIGEERGEKGPGMRF